MTVVSSKIVKDQGDDSGQLQLEIVSIVCCTLISSRDVTVVAGAISVVLHDERLVADVAGVCVLDFGLHFT